MSKESFDLSAYRFATTTEAALELVRQNVVGQPFTANVGISARVGEQITLTLDAGVSCHGIVEQVDGNTMRGTITGAFETPPPPIDDEWDAA